VPAQIHQLSPEGQRLIIKGHQTGNRQPLVFQARIQHEEQRKPEPRHGESEKDEDRHSFIEQRALFPCGKDSDGNGDEQRQQEGNQVDADGQRKALRYFFYNRAGVAGHGVSEIELYDPRQPVEILDVQRTIDPIKRLKTSPRRFSRKGVQRRLHVRRRPRSQMDNKEADEGDPPQHQKHPDCFANAAENKGSCLVREHGRLQRLWAMPADSSMRTCLELPYPKGWKGGYPKTACNKRQRAPGRVPSNTFFQGKRHRDHRPLLFPPLAS